MSTLTEITSEADFSSHLSSLSPSALVVLYFHTPWAAPCAQMGAVLSALASQYPATAPPTISFVSINAEELPDISEEYDVSAVPFVVCLRSGQILESISGSDAVKVRDAVERHAGRGNVAGAVSSMEGVKANIPPPLSAVPREDGPLTATQAPVTTSEPAAPADAANATAVASAPTLTPEQSREALFARLEQLVKAASVMLFMKGTPSSPQCGFSRQLVGILRERSVKYGFFNILADEDVRQGLKEYAEWPTFPQLWVNGELVGGLDIVREEINNDPDFLTDHSVTKPTAAA
ncbi:Glutaredoxin [Penicillium griseofulvum]|uniref:Glutaredoxin n=1 Tax=Penicillium patulum TaxID=5078 RepID=A0A135LSM1_PENPA|nr:Glutaredoxin [Penicillium griseofulvum]KXG51931.1 Glutaredoxin [Penicillium griseofulvum]